MTVIAPAPHHLLGAQVLYTLTRDDCDLIMQQRMVAGTAQRAGNAPHPGDTYAATIVRVWGSQSLDEMTRAAAQTNDGLTSAVLSSINEAWAAQERNRHVNLQVFLDGNDSLWAPSRTEYDPARHGRRNKLEGSGGYEFDGEWISDPRGHWVLNERHSASADAARAVLRAVDAIEPPPLAHGTHAKASE